MKCPVCRSKVDASACWNINISGLGEEYVKLVKEKNEAYYFTCFKCKKHYLYFFKLDELFIWKNNFKVTEGNKNHWESKEIKVRIEFT